jgi:hypothetical protein
MTCRSPPRPPPRAPPTNRSAPCSRVRSALRRSRATTPAGYLFTEAGFQFALAGFVSGSLGQRSLPIGLGVAFGTLGTATLLWPQPERLHDSLIRGLAAGRDPARVVAEIDERLHAAASAARAVRIRTRWAGAIGVALATGAYIADRADGYRLSRNDPYYNPLIASFLAIGTIRFLDSFNDSPIERTTRLWDHEPSLAGAARFALVPVAGGAALTLTGRF